MTKTDQVIRLFYKILENMHSMTSVRSHGTPEKENNNYVRQIRALEREKEELEQTLKLECINSEKMRAHIEWLTDIAENRLKSIGFISTFEYFFCV